MSSARPYTFDRVVRFLAFVLLAAGAVWLINELRNVLLPFCLACLIAYLLEPLVELNQRLLHLKGRVLASLLTIGEVTAVLIGLAVIFGPSIVKEIQQLEELIQHSHDGSMSVPFISTQITEPIRRWFCEFNLSEIIESSYFSSLIHSGSSIVETLVEFLLHTLEWLLTFIYIIFILIDYPTMRDEARQLIPKKYRKMVFHVGNDIKERMDNYFRGQGLLAAIAAVFYCIGFSIVGIPMAIVLGITVGILYMIPYFQYITIIPVAIVCLIDSATGATHFWSEFGECLIVYAVTQSICDYMLTPKIMSKEMGLNPAVILLSLSVWGTLMGLIGMIIALPATALILSYYKNYINNCDPEQSGPATQ